MMARYGLGFWLWSAVCGLLLAFIILQPWVLRFLPASLQRIFREPERPPEHRRTVRIWRVIIGIAMLALLYVVYWPQWRKWLGF
jgi:hypothetical protein